MVIGSFITTYNRPGMLEKSLPHVVALGARVLVVDDGSDVGIAARNRRICESVRPSAPNDVMYLYIPKNRGLACSLMVGLTYWLVDNDIEYISYFQDDVEVDVLLHEALVAAHKSLGGGRMVLTGHDAKEHGIIRRSNADGIDAVMKKSCRATHMFATRESWGSILPIRSKGIGYPKRTGHGRGEGSDVDWWVTRDAPKPLQVWCVPGLVRTFSWQAGDSCWNNQQTAGRDGKISRGAIHDWLARRTI